MIDFPASPTTGQTFKTGNTTYKYDGTGWMSTPQSSITPDAPSDGKVYGRKNAVWTEVGSGVWIGDTPPANKVTFPLWWSATTLQLSIWYDDGNSQQWVDVTSDPQPLAAAVMLIQDGTVAAPALAFLSEPGLGFWRRAASILMLAAQGQNVLNMDFSNSAITFLGVNTRTAAATAQISLNNGVFAQANGNALLLTQHGDGHGSIATQANGTATRGNLTLDAPAIVPPATNTNDLGTAALRWRNIYTNDLQLANGIGDYTVVEGEEDLFLYNNKSGKTFKFALIEVDPATVPAKAKP